MTVDEDKRGRWVEKFHVFKRNFERKRHKTRPTKRKTYRNRRAHCL